MGLIKDGTFMARALSGAFGLDDKRYPTARIDFELIAGPDAGQRITYNGRVDNRSAPYVAKDLKSAGWKGKDLETLSADIDATHVEVPIEIQHKETKDGARMFAVVRSIGRGAKPLVKANASDLKDANDALHNAMAGESPVAVDDIVDDSIPF